MSTTSFIAYICSAIFLIVIFIAVIVARLKDRAILEKLNATKTSVDDWSARNEQAHEQIAEDVKVTRGRVQFLAAARIADELAKVEEDKPKEEGYERHPKYPD